MSWAFTWIHLGSLGLTCLPLVSLSSHFRGEVSGLAQPRDFKLFGLVQPKQLPPIMIGCLTTILSVRLWKTKNNLKVSMKSLDGNPIIGLPENLMRNKFSY